MMAFENVHNVYFIGIGGIGMSAIARYFNMVGKNVAGYDKTPSALTKELEKEGIACHYEDDINLISSSFLKDKGLTLVVYTPAIPVDHSELNYFKSNGYRLIKRAEALGLITNEKKTLAVAGTHGKTTTSTLIAHIMRNSIYDCNAFLGGISKNYDTNLLLSPSSEYIVTEADEFDRSFLHLSPTVAVITSADADHLDIYGTKEEVLKSFKQFIQRIRSGGTLIIKKGVDLDAFTRKDITIYSYALKEEADFYAKNIRVIEGHYVIDVVCPGIIMKDILIGIPGLLNVENSVAAIAVAHVNGISEEVIRQSLLSFQGVRRRFDYHLKTDIVVLIDDYGHHPEELRHTIESVRELYPGKHLTGIFQPHLYTRTRDFADAFAQSLSLLDRVILLDIYPAREMPIPGIDSKMLLDKIGCNDKTLCSKQELAEVVAEGKTEVVIVMGAGDIEKLVEPIKTALEKKFAL
jgi:UDP-N-acetylmuramate--alanine ligase